MPSNNVILVAAGSDAISEGISQDDLGRGFKLNIAPGESPFKAKIFKTESCIVKRPQVKSNNFCEVMDSMEKVNDHLDIAGHLSVSYGPMISGEGAGKYLKNNIQSSRRSSLRYRAQHVHSYSRLVLEDQVPNDTILDGIKNGMFDADTFGTMFVEQVIWGAQLDVTFTVECDEGEDLKQIMASLKGQVGVGVLKVGFSGNFQQKEEHSDKKYKMMIQASASGVSVEIPPNPSLEQVFEIIGDFNKKYKELCGQEQSLTVKDIDRHTYLSPIAFVLARTQDYLPKLNDMQTAFLEQQMGKVAQVFKTASFWIAKLSNAQRECDAEYKRPYERETIARVHRQQVTEELKRLTDTQIQCLQYRQLPLKDLVGLDHTPVAVVPEIYPKDGKVNILEGLVGAGFIDSPVNFGGSLGQVPYSYEGFTVRQDNCNELQPCLGGRLFCKSGNEVACGRTPEILVGLVQITNHKFNPELLQTKIMNADEYDPQCGDIFIPDDMRKMLDKKNGDGELIGPAFQGKRMVLTGPMGSGKTSLFNRLTGSKKRAAATIQTCTTTLSVANARGPASELLILDTPGTANSDVNGMTIEQALELRKALTRGTVSQIVVVISFPNNERKQALSDQLAVAMNNLFDCETFKRDANGIDVTMREASHSSPRRTRAFLVVTHRDCAQLGREKFAPVIEEVRKDFPWVGPVAFIDEKVSLGWLYDTIIACAGYQKESCTGYTIPLVEMFSKFKMTFEPLRDDWMDYIEDAKLEMSMGANCAIEAINEEVKARNEIIHIGGNHVDRVGPVMDCVMRFIDDLFEKTTQETLAKCYDESIDDLWVGTDEHINNEKVNTMNVIKQQLAPLLVGVRKKVYQKFPTAGEAAVYKKCPDCGAVYTRPTGCNYIGVCGKKAGFKKDEHHNGTMNLQLQYDYDQSNKQLKIREGNAGILEQYAWKIRRTFRDMAVWLPIHRSDFQDEYDKHNVDTSMEYGCGREGLRWDMMIALTAQELVKLELVPSDQIPEASAEPCLGSKTMPIGSFLEICGPAYREYKDVLESGGLKKVKDLVDLPQDDRSEMLDALGIKKIHRIMMLNKLRNFKK